ncbi:hypothetical protein BDM02DRAFT_3124267 [Thelephora ganbajun]|uniref:Uncharacterized protein n=1 Tax=Thelephora ganbajun TaxID=370292 RepID=A0ACB6YZE9_THEGA|nr:hypothetical protein BDM02DRAFT_3124267 [Thelephora ganbajun]
MSESRQSVCLWTSRGSGQRVCLLQFAPRPGNFQPHSNRVTPLALVLQSIHLFLLVSINCIGIPPYHPIKRERRELKTS